MNKTFAIITPMLYEHTYFNYFIEYHLNLGFNKIYLLIDNLSGEQYEYKIKNEESKKKIVFYYIKDLLTEVEYEKYKDYHKCILVHTAIQNMYKYVIEDYTMLLGVDSFLYLNNLNIVDFFKKYNIYNYNVSQILFKWVVLFNFDYKSNYNLLNNIDNKINLKKHYDMHFFTLGQRKRVLMPAENTHHYIIKNKTDTIWCNNKIYNIKSSDSFYDISNILGKEDTTRIGCIYHFLMRDMEDILIKTYYFWSKNLLDRKYRIIPFIMTDTKDVHDRLSYINCNNDDSVIINKIIININDSENNYNNDELINKMLTECNLTKEQLLICAEKRGFINQ
jgi:hypothetical protein